MPSPPPWDERRDVHNHKDDWHSTAMLVRSERSASQTRTKRHGKRIGISIITRSKEKTLSRTEQR